MNFSDPFLPPRRFPSLDPSILRSDSRTRHSGLTRPNHCQACCKVNRVWLSATSSTTRSSSNVFWTLTHCVKCWIASASHQCSCTPSNERYPAALKLQSHESRKAREKRKQLVGSKSRHTLCGRECAPVPRRLQNVKLTNLVTVCISTCAFLSISNHKSRCAKACALRQFPQPLESCGVTITNEDFLHQSGRSNGYFRVTC